MNKYESVIIISPKIKNDSIKLIKQSISDLINTYGKITKIEDLGKRKLAYQIKKNTEGYYIVFYFCASSKLISELTQYYRVLDEILKYITIKQN